MGCVSFNMLLMCRFTDRVSTLSVLVALCKRTNTLDKIGKHWI